MKLTFPMSQIPRSHSEPNFVNPRFRTPWMLADLTDNDRYRLSSDDYARATEILSRLEVQGVSGQDVAYLYRLGIDLSSYTPFHQDYRGVDMSQLRLKGVKLSGPRLEESHWQGSVLTDCEFRSLNAEHADFGGTKFVRVRLDPAVPFHISSGSMVKTSNFLEAAFHEVQAKFVEFHECDFSGAQLEGSDFRHTTWQQNQFANAKITNSDFSGARFFASRPWHGAEVSNCVFDHAQLRRIPWGFGFFEGCSFRGANLRGANLGCSEFTRAKFEGADLSDADLEGAVFPNAMFDGARLQGMKGRGGYFADSSFKGSQLRGADFRDANLRGCDFRGCDFRGVNFTGAQMDDCLF